MSALSQLLRARTALSDRQVDHLQRLVGEWQLLADLSFADLLLWVPVPGGEAGATEAFLCVAQCRPTTGPTAYQHHQVGVLQHGSRATPLTIALREARIFREVEPDWDGDLPIRREAIPVRADGAVIAVLGKDANLASVRTPSQLELVYLQSAADLSAMVADGTFPHIDRDPDDGPGLRVGDGLMRLEPDGTVIYASPNALSALTRLGISGTVVGEPIDELTASPGDSPFDGSALAKAVSVASTSGEPASIEVGAAGTTVRFRALPLRPRGETLGALLLMQDVTELRRRDRLLLGKDATIREIHQRVTHDLQTVAALLRSQSGRASVPEARAALEESTRRVASIALVHKTLANSADESVDFDEVVDRVLGILAEAAGDGARTTLRREGSFGDVPAEVATPLVLVVGELVQKALDHAFAGDARVSVVVALQTERGARTLTVSDDGMGLSARYGRNDAEAGLEIVRTLVAGELGGTVEFRPRATGAGTEAVVTLPAGRRAPGDG